MPLVTEAVRRIDVHHVELLPAELESSMRQAVMPDLARTISYMPERRMLSAGWPSLAFARTSAPASPHDDAERAARDRDRAHELALFAGPDRVDLQPMGWGGERAASLGLRRIEVIAQGDFRLYECRQRSIAAG